MADIADAITSLGSRGLSIILFSVLIPLRLVNSRANCGSSACPGPSFTPARSWKKVYVCMYVIFSSDRSKIR